MSGNFFLKLGIEGEISIKVCRLVENLVDRTHSSYKIHISAVENLSIGKIVELTLLFL